jgi:TPR repeat protein
LAKQADVNHNQGLSISYMEKAAEMGSAVCQGALGMQYLNGGAEVKNLQKAIYWFTMAAKQGQKVAKLELGIIYEDGQGVPADEAKAIAYLKAAADQDDSYAEHRLGLDYEMGRGVPHNRSTAILYLRKAAAHGVDVAAATADALSRATKPQFHTIDEIDAYVYPPPPPAPAGSCPRWGVLTTGPTAQSMISLFCSCHPGCPYSSPGFSMTCPNAGAAPVCR